MPAFYRYAIKPPAKPGVLKYCDRLSKVAGSQFLLQVGF